MKTIYGITKKETQRFPIIAGMPFGNTKFHGLKKVGYKVIEFTYDINPNNPDDKMLLSQKEVKRVFN